MHGGGDTLLDAARWYLARGYAPVPIPAGTKAPALKGWQRLRLDEAALPLHFNGTGNIGLILGEPSGHLVDVDLDCAEARELAADFLPLTGAKTGRPGAPVSHWWYIAPGARTRRHADPVDRSAIVELRGAGTQTLVGPSVHPSGEAYDPLEGDPARVDSEELAACVARLAEAVIERRHGRKEAIASQALALAKGPLPNRQRRPAPGRGVPRRHAARDLGAGRAQPDLRRRDRDGARLRPRRRRGVGPAPRSVQPALRASVVGARPAPQGRGRGVEATCAPVRLAARRQR